MRLITPLMAVAALLLTASQVLMVLAGVVGNVAAWRAGLPLLACGLYALVVLVWAYLRLRKRSWRVSVAYIASAALLSLAQAVFALAWTAVPPQTAADTGAHTVILSSSPLESAAQAAQTGAVADGLAMLVLVLAIPHVTSLGARWRREHPIKQRRNDNAERSSAA